MARRKPVRRDPRTGIEMCPKKVQGFPCRYLLGHAQACDVDWNAAYPDEEQEANMTDESTMTLPEGMWGAVDDKREEANRIRAAKNNLESCEICGRGVRPGNGWVVEVVAGGSRLARVGSNPDTSDPGYMGVWILGPECGKKVPMAFRAKWNGWED